MGVLQISMNNMLHKNGTVAGKICFLVPPFPNFYSHKVLQFSLNALENWKPPRHKTDLLADCGRIILMKVLIDA